MCSMISLWAISNLSNPNRCHSQGEESRVMSQLYLVSKEKLRHYPILPRLDYRQLDTSYGMA